jgi:hypothetical protein
MRRNTEHMDRGECTHIREIASLWHMIAVQNRKMKVAVGATRDPAAVKTAT